MAENALCLVISISASTDSARFRPISRAAFTDPARLPPCFNVLLSELSIEIWAISPKGHSLSGRKRGLHLEAVYGGGFAGTRLRAMELITMTSLSFFLRPSSFTAAYGCTAPAGTRTPICDRSGGPRRMPHRRGVASGFLLPQVPEFGVDQSCYSNLCKQTGNLSTSGQTRFLAASRIV
jgi:hypothetical protein